MALNGRAIPLQLPFVGTSHRSVGLTPASDPPPPTPIRASAPLRPVLEHVTVSAPGAAVGARIAHVEARIGDRVAEGDLLFVLDSRDAVVTEIAAVVSTTDARAEALATAQARAQGRIENARSEQARVEARARGPRQQLLRMQRLRERRIVTAADLDRAVAANDRALRETHEAASAVQALVEGIDPEVEFAQLEMDAALAALDKAELRVVNALIRSPRAGRVVAIMANVGDLLTGQALLDIEVNASGAVAGVDTSQPAAAHREPPAAHREPAAANGQNDAPQTGSLD